MLGIFSLIEAQYIFVSTSKAHPIYLNKQQLLHPGTQTRKLYDTRWSCRYRSLNSICCTFDALIATLEEFRMEIIVQKQLKLMDFYNR